MNIHDYTVGPGGTYMSNGYVINAYGNTVDTSGNDFTPEKAVFYNRVFMKNYAEKQIHAQFGNHQTMPKHNGGIVNIRGISPYPTKTTPLREGVTPEPNAQNYYYIEIPVNQYGAFTPITDWARFAARDDVVVKDAEELSSQAGRTIEEIDVEVLNGGANVMYSPAVASDGTETPVTTRAAVSALSKFRVKDCFRALNFLELQNAEPVDGNHFVAVVHPNVKFDILNDPQFESIVKYSDAELIYNGEIGRIANIRFVKSNFAKVFKGAGLNSADVYSTLVIAKDAYDTIEIEGEGMQTIIKPLGSAGSADPLNQRSSQGWKTTHGIGITGQCFILRIESGSSSNMTGIDFNNSSNYIKGRIGERNSSGNIVPHVVA